MRDGLLQALAATAAEEAEDPAFVEIPLTDIVVGEEYEGIVNNVVAYGAFIDMGAEVRSRRAMYAVSRAR